MMPSDYIPSQDFSDLRATSTEVKFMKSVILKPELENQTKSSPERGRSYIKWFSEIGIKDVPLVGGKTASLGEMFRELVPKGVKVPDGFAITAQGTGTFCGKRAWTSLLLQNFATSTRMTSSSCKEPEPRSGNGPGREATLSARFIARPRFCALTISCARRADRPISVAVRSSATAEDCPKPASRVPTGNLPECDGPRSRDRGVPALLRLTFH